MNKLKTEMMAKMDNILEMLETEKGVKVQEQEENMEVAKEKDNKIQKVEKKKVTVKEKEKANIKVTKEKTCYKCENCDYTSQKETLLKKHRNTKHCNIANKEERENEQGKDKSDETNCDNTVKEDEETMFARMMETYGGRGEKPAVSIEQILNWRSCSST